MAIKRVQAAIPQKTQLEILKGCLCRDGWLVATDTMLTAKVRVDDATDECIIPQQAFPLIESLRHGEVEITKGNGDIRIKQGDIKCRYLSKDPADFPTQSTETETEIMVNADDLIGSINRVSYAMKNGSENDKMSSICLKAGGGTLSIVALDGYMIAWDRRGCEGEFELMVPARAVRTISSIGFMDEIRIRIGKHKATFASEDCEVTTTVLDGEFFQFEKMFKLKVTTLVTADRKMFLDSMKRASLFEKTGDKKPLAIEVSGDRMTILLVTTDSSYHENLPVTSKGEGLRIGMNVALLKKTLAAFYDDEIYIGMVNPRSPIVIREKGTTFLACVLPVLLRTEQKEGNE